MAQAATIDPPVKATGYREINPADVKFVICNRCETVLLDSARAQRQHTNLHAQVESALPR